MTLSLLGLLACTTTTYSPKDTSAGDTGGIDSGETQTDTVRPPDTEGPDLPACTPRAGTGSAVALAGVVLTPDGPEAGMVVVDRASGTITCAGATCDPGDATVVCTEGVISPGLIDAHNHLQYNVLPPWQVGPEFTDRYDWRSDGRYWDYRTAYDAIEDAYGCEIMKWAEARELVHGTTAAVGSSGGSCIRVLIRNLDEDEAASGIPDYDLRYSAGTVTDTIDESDGASFTERLASGAVDGVLNHVAEGRDGAVRGEAAHMIASGMVGPGQGYVHATDVNTQLLAQMAAAGTAIVWSPRSNLALYGTTTPVEVAERLGVPWAIGTDWTWSGSMAPTRELQCADEWLAGKGFPISDVALWRKSTEDAARVVGLDGVLGALAPGYRADIAVFRWSRTPYRAIIASEPQDVRLVMVDGAARFGETALVDALASNPAWCEAMDVCGESRSLCVKDADSGEDAQTLAEVEATLTGALAAETMPDGYAYANVLYPLFTCGVDRDSCDLRAAAASDEDGDGVADTEDACDTVYDPLQWDTDRDGIGDACDPCPISAEGESCGTDPADVDGDRIGNAADNCPWAGNAEQRDTDADGQGDACDSCPDQFDDATNPCRVSIAAVRDRSRADHPDEGARVSVQGVVTALRDGEGFFIQDGAQPFSGLYVYDRGANDVARGETVEVGGTYVEFYGFSELTNVTVTRGAAGVVPPPTEVSACDVATGGAGSEGYESMLIRVVGADVTNINPDAPRDFDEFEVNGCLRVDDWLYEALDQPTTPSTRYSRIDGVLIYTFGNAKLAPRDGADLVP
ncbi:MAG: hypothetical protein RLZZ299_2076 [Pseudomonadota bacterium]|jgi:cytosine/adenosine deaminase-related metal-dependent hydrolase